MKRIRKRKIKSIRYWLYFIQTIHKHKHTHKTVLFLETIMFLYLFIKGIIQYKLHQQQQLRQTTKKTTNLWWGSAWLYVVQYYVSPDSDFYFNLYIFYINMFFFNNNNNNNFIEFHLINSNTNNNEKHYHSIFNDDGLCQCQWKQWIWNIKVYSLLLIGVMIDNR